MSEQVGPGGITLAAKDAVASQGESDRKSKLSGSELAKQAGYMASARVVAQVAQFSTFLLASRLLGPADFGVYALVFVIAFLVNEAAQSGWRELAMADEAEADVAQTMSWIASIAMGGILAIVGTLAYAYFPGIGTQIGLGTVDFDVFALLMLFSVHISLCGAVSVQYGRLVTFGKVGTLSKIQTVCEIVAFVVVATALINDFGIVSLGFGQLASSMTALTLSYLALSPRRFRMPRVGETRRIIRFVTSILLSRAAFFINDSLVLIIVGAYLGPASVGFFRAGGRFAGAIADAISEAMRVTSWSSLQRAFGEAKEHGTLETEKGRPIPPPEAADSLLRLIGGGAYVVIPAFVGLALVAPSFIVLVLGPTWQPAAIILSIFALRRLVMLPGVLLAPLLAMTDRLPVGPVIAVLTSVVTVGMLMIFAPLGMEWAAVGQLFAGLISLALTLAVLAWIGRMSLAKLAAVLAAPCFASLVMALALIFAFGLDPMADGDTAEAPFRLIGAVVLGVAVYGTVVIAVSQQARTLAQMAMRTARQRAFG
ncbi:MAG: oligosaccharide flippase family protein [Pseudomonadota bacterium]